MDPLSSLLQHMQPRGHIFFTGEYCGDFAVDTSGSGQAHFHVVTDGQCWLDTADWHEHKPLLPGDLVMFPHDARHALLPHEPDSKTSVDPEAFVSLICGYYEFSSQRINPVLESLPEVVVVRSRNHPDNQWMDTLLKFMKHESHNQTPGSAMVIDRLAEVLFMYILRTLINRSGQHPDFLRALADPALARALNAIHNHPETNWTVQKLAEVAAMSRTAFSNRFGQYIKMTPMAYLSRYRMDVASEWLRQGTKNMDTIAAQCGYESTAAFSKAFKKVTGLTPGKIRRQEK